MAEFVLGLSLGVSLTLGLRTALDRWVEDYKRRHGQGEAR